MDVGLTVTLSLIAVDRYLVITKEPLTHARYYDAEKKFCYVLYPRFFVSL